MKRFGILVSSILFATFLVTPAQGDQNGQSREDSETKRVMNYWTNARINSATPRDFLVDAAGDTFMGDKNGKFSKYGDGTKLKSSSIELNSQSALTSQIQVPQATPVKLADTIGPLISGMSPASGTTSNNSTNIFSATITDVSAVRSAVINLTSPTGARNSFSLTKGTTNIWSVSIRNFTSGTWQWNITATDNSTGRNKTTSSPLNNLVVALPSTLITTNSSWKTSSPVLSASGRLFFEMPTKADLAVWAGYVCSATVINDGLTNDGQSVILTAAHCVYDDANKAFARNVIFIPNQQSSGTKTDSNCLNDIYGCWVMNYGIVDSDWTTRVFPNNIPWDYGYYVVSNTGKHTQGTTSVSDSLEIAVEPMTISFATPTATNTSAFGYSYSFDPNLMYCAQSRGFTGGSSATSSDNWWLSKCGLTGGASGGPWVDENSVAGNGQIISVNSWGYTNKAGMAGAKLNQSSQTVRTKLPICIYNSAIVPMATPPTNKIVSTCP